MRIKTIYDRLKPGFKSSLQKNARQYSSAKRLKYTLMSKTSWYCDVKTYDLSAQDIIYGNSIITK